MPRLGTRTTLTLATRKDESLSPVSENRSENGLDLAVGDDPSENGLELAVGLVERPDAPQELVGETARRSVVLLVLAAATKESEDAESEAAVAEDLLRDRAVAETGVRQAEDLNPLGRRRAWRSAYEHGLACSQNGSGKWRAPLRGCEPARYAGGEFAGLEILTRPLRAERAGRRCGRSTSSSGRRDEVATGR
jgi:hypothetical protein